MSSRKQESKRERESRGGRSNPAISVGSELAQASAERQAGPCGLRSAGPTKRYLLSEQPCPRCYAPMRLLADGPACEVHGKPPSDGAPRLGATLPGLHPSKRERVWFEVEEMRRGRAKGSRRAFRKPLAHVAGSEPAVISGDRVFTRGSGKPNDERSIWLAAGGPENASAHRRELIARELARVGSRVKLDDRMRVELHILEEFERGREPRPCDVAGALVREDQLAALYERSSAEQKIARYSYRVIAALLLGVTVK